MPRCSTVVWGGVQAVVFRGQSAVTLILVEAAQPMSETIFGFNMGLVEDFWFLFN